MALLIKPQSARLSWCLKRHLKQQSIIAARHLFSKIGAWDDKLSNETRFELEEFWKDKVISKDLSQDVSQDDNNEKYYVLSMFPYPSGKLHMGHVRVYTISDTMARYHKMTGKQVIHPMGWDAFGLPAENAAIDRGELPQRWTNSNIASMKQQMKELCCDFDWSREFATCDPAYYRWTQYIFLKMMESGLVYQKQGMVNWDPVDKTVLADEQIDENGCSWRSGAVVEKKYLRQWYIRITAYAKELYDGLEEVDQSMWREISKLQKAWIGKCQGCRFTFKIMHQSQILEEPIDVFTDKPEALFGVSHILLPKDHWLIHKYGLETQDGKLNFEAIHPITNQKMPIFIDSSTSEEKIKEEHLGIPACSEVDREFANKHSLRYQDVFIQDADGNEHLGNSADFTGMTRTEAFHAITEYARKKQFGGHISSAKLNDWLISRQRYWDPIPIIHCPKCKAVPVPCEELPVTLPEIKKLTTKGMSPLQDATDWINVKCPKCGSDAKRETDTMDTFVDSSWYFLRYTDPYNTVLPFSKELADRCMPVDLYIGGKEHAILHLYFARFFQRFLYGRGMVSHKEPFIHLLTQGMVMGESYQVKETGKYIPPSDVDFSDKKPVEKKTGAALISRWEKMSKSKYNGVDPQNILKEFGVDLTRLSLLANAAPKSNQNWSRNADGVMHGLQHWQSRLWRLVTEFRTIDSNLADMSAKEYEEHRNQLYIARNTLLRHFNFYMTHTFLIHTGITRMQTVTNQLMKTPEAARCSQEYSQTLCDLVIMLAPMAPLFASELWSGLQSVNHRPVGYRWDKGVLKQNWPEMDPEFKLPIYVEVDHDKAFHIGVPVKDFKSVTCEQAVKLASEHKEFIKTFSTQTFVKTSLTKRKDNSGVLRFISEKKQVKADESDSEELNSTAF